MNIDLTNAQAERLRDFVTQELQAIKDEEMEQGATPDMAEVNELLDLAGLLGETVAWADFDNPPDDEPEPGKAFY